MRRAALLLAIVALPSPVFAQALTTPAERTAIAAEAAHYPLFRAEVARARALVDRSIRAGVNVPVPRDPGGGATHEQHKRNYQAIYLGGRLFAITGERAYADHVRALLLAYADLYPRLGPHPAASNQVPGRLFWQSLNDSVFLVHAIQGYDAIRATLNEADRRRIDDDVFRRMARFLSDETPQAFDRIHNHATWATAGVGMTGYVLGDRSLVEKALRGTDLSGRGGFLRQLDLLFSPDGYYAEGPYYQRYAIQPFVVFARAIETNEPQRQIFAYRDALIPRAIRATIQATYRGHFFPINDAMPDKSLDTEELYQAVAIGYGQGRDPALLSIAEAQGRTVLTPDGLELARDLAGGLARPFPFRSMLLRDGANGDQGALAILRSDPGPTSQTLVAKNTSQGMGHGHFDRLNWLLYDNGAAIVTDYGAARFLNIEAKDGGRYLPENESWAKQTIAHNTLVVNETSHFGGRLRPAEAAAPRQLFFHGEGPVQVSTAEESNAYPGLSFRRTLAQLAIEGFVAPIVVDLMRVDGARPARYDLPLHYAGQIIETGFPLRSNPTTRPVLGTANGYQHLWVDAVGRPDGGNGRVTWQTGNRFYTYHLLPPAGTEIVFAESGANDPRFNLRREPVLIQRVDGATDATFISLLEPHGAYDAAAETVVASRSRIRAVRHVRAADADLVTIETDTGRSVTLAIADDTAEGARHRAEVDGEMLEWTGHFGRFERTDRRP